MIVKTRRIKAQLPDTRQIWIIPGLWIVCLYYFMDTGIGHVAHDSASKDFLNEGMVKGEFSELRSVTIIAPGGQVLIRNEGLSEPILWDGTLDPIGSGLFINERVIIEATMPSEFLCISPFGNGNHFEGKAIRREFIAAGESYTFGKYDMGYGVLVGHDAMNGFTVEQGDVLSVDEDTILGVVSKRVA